MTHLVSLREVVKCYGGQRVLSIEECYFARGDRVFVTGANGSGKSALLRLLARVSRPTRGDVVMEPALEEARLGYVPQKAGLYGHLTVRENLHRRLRLFRRPRSTLEESALPEALGIMPHMDKRLDALSGGYQRLAAVAASLLVEPGWLIWDEPFAGVDAENTRVICDCLRARADDLRLVIAAGPELVHEDLWTRVIVLEPRFGPCDL